MRNPIRSEADAFHVAIGGAVVIGVSLALGAAVDPLLGLAVFLSAIAGALFWEFATTDPDRRRPLREAAAEARRDESATGPRVLVVANRTLHGEELRAELRRRGAAGGRVRIVAPILTSRLHYIASDVDVELAEARERLSAALAWARSEGLAATGRVGDPMAALGAIEDELRMFGADEVIISTYPHGRSNWLETGIVDRLTDELDIPVLHVVVQPERAAVAR